MIALLVSLLLPLQQLTFKEIIVLTLSYFDSRVGGSKGAFPRAFLGNVIAPNCVQLLPFSASLS